MRIIKGLFSRSSEAGEFIQFLWKARQWFLIPFILILFVFGIVLIFAQSSGVAPFIYTLF